MIPRRTTDPEPRPPMSTTTRLGGAPDPEIVSSRLLAFPREAGGTRLTWRMRFERAEEAERVRGPLLEANEQNFDRLEALLGAP